MASALVHLGIDQTQHVQLPSMLQTPITGTVGPVPI